MTNINTVQRLLMKINIDLNHIDKQLTADSRILKQYLYALMTVNRYDQR